MRAAIDQREEIVGALAFTWNDYLLALPITLLRYLRSASC